MSLFSATVQTEITAQQAAVFKHIVPIDLASIFTGYGPLPSVAGTQNQTGAWDAAGQTRTVTFSDGSSASELLTKYEYPRYFSYTVSGFTGALRLLTTSANGEWWFDTNPSSGATSIKWRYAFNARSVFAAPILWLITNILWRGYMRKALTLSKAQIESSAAQQGVQPDGPASGGPAG
ncbi:MAG TPA: SRPBCC family protein [bacterium]|nr:SRPBCC family protein [bacterium]